MTRLRAAATFLLAIAALSSAACQDDLTEVLVILDSDLRAGLDVDSVMFVPQIGGGTPQQFDSCTASGAVGSFPLSMAFVSDGDTKIFSVRIELSRSFQQPTSTRLVTNVRFTPDQLRMLVVPMKAACACVGTSCPAPGSNPDCDRMDNPETIPFDANLAPTPNPNGFVCSSQNGGFSGGVPIR